MSSSWRALLSLRRGASVLVVNRGKHGGGGGGQGSGQGGVGAGLAIAAGLVAAKVYSDRDRITLKADTHGAEVLTHENRVRMYMARDTIFNYFASVQLITKSGKSNMMMTPMNFYSSITPDCTISHGVGAGIHVKVLEEEVEGQNYYRMRSSVEGGILNKIGDLGLLSYADYCFLLTLIATPRRYIDTTFNLFDVNGAEAIEAKEFAYVSTQMADKAGGFGSYTDVDQEEILASSSGLLNYLFGKDRKGTFSREAFQKLQTDLLDEIIQLEFSEYDTDGSGRISEVDLCHFLLKNTKVPPKKMANMLKRVEKVWPRQARGISLPSFRNLFHVLAGGAELDRALFFLDVENIGVDLEEFRTVSSWVSQQELSDHVAKVLFVLLDEDSKGRFFKEDIGAVLIDWRQSRGFDKGSLRVSLGQLRI